MKPVYVRLVGRFRLSGKIPGHHEHLLYSAVHTQTDATLFLKGEEIKSRPGLNFLTILQYGKILQTMQGGIGIPHMHWCGQYYDFNFIVLYELGPNLNYLLRKCNNKFTLKSVLMLGAYIISILQYYHFKNFIHNHVNPKHLMIGTAEKYGKIFLVDYSNSIRYRDAQTLEHISYHSSPDKKIEMRTINMYFSSIRYHKGLIPSRKDDLISLIYMMLYLLKGYLPWSSIVSAKRTYTYKSKLVLYMKYKTTPQQLFYGHPDLLQLYYYTYKLAFDYKPRYTYYKNIFTERMYKEGEIDDKIYDWYLVDEEEDEIDVDLNFDVIPNYDEFIKQLTEEIKVREKTEVENDKTINPKADMQGKSAKKKNDKDCVIY